MTERDEKAISSPTRPPCLVPMDWSHYRVHADGSLSGRLAYSKTNMGARHLSTDPTFGGVENQQEIAL